MTVYVALAPHPEGVVTVDGGLPGVDVADLPAAVAALRDLGVTGRLLRPSAKGDMDGVAVQVLEFDEGDPARDGTTIERIAADLAPPLRDRVVAWAEEIRTGVVPEQRPRWASPGWFDGFSAWIDDAIRAAGADPVGTPRVVRQWAISAVWARESTDGVLYGKAVFGSPPVPGVRAATGFWHEPALTSLLWSEHGDVVSEPVAVDVDRGLMLMRDMAGTPLDESDADPAPALSRLAAIQRHWRNRHDELIAVGCQDRRPSTVLDRAAGLVAARRGVTDDRALQFAAALPVLRWMAEDLESGPVPLTLTHGDLHDGNTAVRADGGVVLFDWSDGAIGHPFMDLDVFLRRRDAAEHDHLTKAYLAEWSDLADPARLDELLDTARLFSRLNQAVTSFDLAERIEPDDRPPFERGLSGSWELFFDAWRLWRVRVD